MRARASERRRRLHLFTAAAAAAALLASAQGALAEHVYAHRYLLSGRILDADGDPVAGLAIPFGFTGFSGGDLCDGVKPLPITNAYGDFSYCFHLHDLDPGDEISFGVKAGEVRRPVNLLTRWTHENVRAKNASLGVEPPEDFQRVYWLSGKVWQETAPGRFDGVFVQGVALAGVNVTVTARNEPSNETVVANSTTDEYGEYAVRLRFANNVTYGHVTIAAKNRSLEMPLDAFFMTYRQDLRLPGNATHESVEPGPPPAPLGDIASRGLDIANFPDNPVGERPGASSPALSGGALLVALVAFAAGSVGVALWARSRRSRE